MAEQITAESWREFAQELLDELLSWDLNINIKPDLLHRAREMGLRTEIEQQCLDCGTIGPHHCQGVPGGFSEDPE